MAAIAIKKNRKKNIPLQKARIRKGLTQEALAKKLGYNGRSAVSNWENGHIDPPLRIAMKLSELLETDLKQLFPDYQVQETHTGQGGDPDEHQDREVERASG